MSSPAAMVPDPLDALYLARTHHLPLRVDAADAATGSRVGGNPPLPLTAAPPRCPTCGSSLEYLLTLAGDTIGSAVARGRAVSLLTCRDMVCRMSSHTLSPSSSIVLVVHDDAPRAAEAGELQTDFEGRRLVVAAMESDPLREGIVYTDASKIGGLPGFIQGWGAAEAEKSLARGGRFLFQWSENGYRRDMTQGAYPFLGGVVYVFSAIDPATGLPLLDDLMGFWQNS